MVLHQAFLRNATISMRISTYQTFLWNVNSLLKLLYFPPTGEGYGGAFYLLRYMLLSLYSCLK